jgi:hypothetical protein
VRGIQEQKEIINMLRAGGLLSRCCAESDILNGNLEGRFTLNLEGLFSLVS